MDDMLTMWPLFRAIMPFTTSLVSATTLRKLVSIICLASCRTQQSTAAVSLPSTQLPHAGLHTHIYSVINHPSATHPMCCSFGLQDIVRPLKGLWMNDHFVVLDMAELLSGFATTRKGGNPQSSTRACALLACLGPAWHKGGRWACSMSAHLDVVSTDSSNPQGQASIVDEDVNIPELLRQLLGQLRHSPQVTHVKSDRVDGHLQDMG